MRMPTAPTIRALRSPRLITIVRRVHLYSGLALLPWLLVYGVSALLFNHPALTGRNDVVAELGDDDLASHVPVPSEAAALVASALRHHQPAHEITVDGDAARWVHALRAEGHDGEQPLRLALVLDDRGGAIRKREPPAPAPPGMSNPVELGDAGIAADAFEPLMTAVVASRLADPIGWELRATPVLELPLEIDGRAWTASYDLRKHTLELDDPEAPPELARGLARLHMTHGYPRALGLAWVHAVIVDLVAGCMLFWALSGIAMWWQMRRLRRLGAAMLLAAAMVAIAVVAGEWPTLVR